MCIFLEFGRGPRKSCLSEKIDPFLDFFNFEIKTTLAVDAAELFSILAKNQRFAVERAVATNTRKTQKNIFENMKNLNLRGLRPMPPTL